MSSLVEACEVRRSFAMETRTLDVLRGVNLAVAEGESLAVTGMSGAGKSTLLHVLGGLDRPTSGRVLYRGRDLYAAGDRERSAIRAQKIGFVFQAYHLLPELTVLENVLLPGLSAAGAFLRGPKLRARAADLLGRVGLVRVSATRREDCNDCLDCFAACPEQHVIRLPLKGAHKGVGPMIKDSDCTSCGRCIDVCAKDVFQFVPRFAPNADDQARPGAQPEQ